MARALFVVTLIAVLLIPNPSTVADEGMWMPFAVGTTLDAAEMRALGLEIDGAAIWSKTGPSLKDAMLMVGNASGAARSGISGFGSAAFVSPKGLILTNHHVAYDALAALSTPTTNFAEKGFIAKALGDERHCGGMAMQVTKDIVDVTDRVLAEVSPEMDADARGRAVQRAIRGVLRAARDGGESHCDVKEMMLGTKYYLFTFDVFRDIRMVYAPPRAIGEFGGDIDNWMWPRHTGDFTYLRAYVGPNGERRGFDEANVPFEPKAHLKLSIAGHDVGDFCFIMGHPGSTYRYRTSYSVDYWEKVNYPRQIEAVQSLIQQLEESTRGNERAQLASSSQLKQYNNALKNFQGMVDGMKALKVADRRRAFEAELKGWIESDAERKKKWGHIFPELDRLYSGLAGGDAQFRQEFNATVPAIRRDLIAALAAHSETSLYPDANMTLRMTYGSIGGYSPRDAVWYRHFTTMEGLAAKNTGKAPFDVPADQLAAIEEKNWGRYADPRTGSVPTCFLSDTDITGGNSGSPIMNGRGEMIGIAFDGNYEGMTSDFKFDQDITRTISVDVRYVLWCTEKLAGLDRLLEEMTVVGSAN